MKTASRAGVIAALVLLSLFAAGMAWVLARAGAVNHLAFNTSRLDLGVYVSRFREASQGRLFGCSLCGSGRTPYEHLEPIVALLSPLYALFPDARTLIALQCVALASGAIPLFLYARRSVPPLVAAVLAVAYVLYPPLQEIALFDFHTVALAVPIALWLVWALERGSLRIYWALAVLLLLVREDMGFVLATVGVYALTAAPERARTGWLTLGLAAAALLAMQLASPAGVLAPFNEVVADFTGGGRRAPRLTVPPVDLPTAAVEHLFAESKALHAVELLAPLLAVPVLARGRVLLLYGAALAFLATSALPGSRNAHEAALLVPFLFVLAAQALGRIRAGELAFAGLSGPDLSRSVAFGILLCSLLACYELGGVVKDVPYRVGPRMLQRTATKEQRELDESLRKLSVSWPRDTKVAASGTLGTHLGTVGTLYTLDDRAYSDYVVASMKQRSVARRLEAEAQAGQLAPVATFGDTHVYRAHYRSRLSRRERQLDDE